MRGFLLFLVGRRRFGFFLVITDDAFAWAHLEYGALLTSHCQGDGTQCHDGSPGSLKAGWVSQAL